MEKAATDQARMAALDARPGRRDLFRTRFRHHRCQLDPRMGRLAARRAILIRVLPARFRQPLERNRRRHFREPVDDGGVNRRRDSDFDSGRHRRRPQYRTCPSLLFLPRNSRGLAQLSGNHPGDLFRKAVRFRTIRRLRDAVIRHHRLLRQVTRRRHRGHGAAKRKRCARPARAGCNGSITACSRK